MTNLAITGGTLVDPEEGSSGGRDIACVEGLLVADTGAEGGDTIGASGKHVAPGIVDFGAFAADVPACIAGGITRLALMPDQSPIIDEAGIVQHAAAKGKPDLWVHPLGAATQGLRGEELAEMGLMQRAGAVAIATGRRRIEDSAVMHKVLSYAAALDCIVITQAVDETLAGGSVATSGETATRLGLSDAPAIAEAVAIARDIMLAGDTGGHVHFHQVTTARGFELVREAKQRGIGVSCGITPAHLLLCDVDIGPYRSFAKLSPPLRSAEDRDAAQQALADGTIDVICSAHDPQGPEAKRLPYHDAQPGMAGAETLLALSLNLVSAGRLDLPQLFALLSTNPAKLLGIPGGSLKPGAPADLVIFDPGAPWKIDSEAMASKAGNTPFDGLPVQGKVLHTIKGGRPLERPPS